ncbi:MULTISPECIES: hypothetical protein [Limnospira]|uniref:Uncharacterized protein n=1 Tax=Limnospira fusiformis PMC 851.14 TaxID=2219512 RepID=A0ABU9EVF5_LIMFS|nr:hypothetical protein [Limnospira maxima]QJB25083.1 hypothetical protein HFV01_03780 [Limnospira fusiformis SAG 85.79]RAQ39857.1 hypothetical protein B9S53_19255 [Arthrospira sp. O9.13F]
MNAAYQPISLLSIDDGSSRTFGFPNHGWLAVVSFLVLGYTSKPSVPRFSPKVVNPETRGGYRSYPHLCRNYSVMLRIITLCCKVC